MNRVFQTPPSTGTPRPEQRSFALKFVLDMTTHLFSHGESRFVRKDTLRAVFIPELLRIMVEFLGSCDVAIRFICKISHTNLRSFSSCISQPCVGLYKMHRDDEKQRRALPFVTSVTKLEWARKALGLPVTLNVCCAAIQVGNLEVLAFLREKEAAVFPWDVTLCRYATIFGHLHVLQWVRAQYPPCEWDAHVCMNAAYTNRLDVLQWARAQRPPCDWYLRECVSAARRSSAEMQSWLESEERASKSFIVIEKACPLSISCSIS